ncbi:transcription factor bHLH106-like [Diospyros lotus]|uniref:transcription factor bHLH106-like n=1 Tax=Diospyros lotus TaxID=55363 RepID=UPI00225B6FF5|nr:transcription factor bHLH106-like [Diospyros lotus]
MLPYQNDSWWDSISNLKSKTMKTLKMGDGVAVPMAAPATLQKQKSEAALKKHAVDERRRRRRINTHLRTLRHLLFPTSSSKVVKAAVLKEAVRRVKELKKMAEVEAGGEWWRGGGATWSFMFPGESDEATVSYYKGREGKAVVKATVCCQDRPGLNQDLSEAVRMIGARVVGAEMATVGGRTKAEVVVQWLDGGGGEDVGSLRRALKALVESRALGYSGLGLVVNGYPGACSGK